MSDAAKRAAAQAAAALVAPGMRLGLGSGSTMRFVLEALAARGLRCTGVPTSEATAALARGLGLAVAELDGPLDLALDGADEVELGTLRLIKGLGGALLREKIVAEAARRFVVVADGSKLVARLGSRAPLPVEVTRFGHEATAERLAGLGCRPALRLAGGAAFTTDNGNLIYDCAFAGIGDPYTMERRLRAIAGVLGTGLFLGRVEQAVIGTEDGGVQVIHGA